MACVAAAALVLASSERSGAMPASLPSADLATSSSDMPGRALSPASPITPLDTELMTSGLYGGMSLALLEVAPGLGEAIKLGAGTGPLQLAALSTSRPSGLPWRSGSSCSRLGLATWRERPLDVQVSFVHHRTWQVMLDHLGGPLSRDQHPQTPQPIVTLPMMPKNEVRQFARCANGAFDNYFRQFGRLLVEGGAGHAVIRLGWEWNRDRPWSPATKEDAPLYKACFQREARILKQTAPGLSIEWTNGRRSYVPFSPLDGYPGDQSVDFVGLHYYDSFNPKIRDQAQWDRYSAAKHYGGPQGIGEWLKFAKSRGKKLAISEWGVTDWTENNPKNADNPYYIEKMYTFFRTNAANLAYENYFSCADKHELYPSAQYPNSRAKYKQLWSAGR